MGAPTDNYPQPGKPYGGFELPKPSRVHSRIGYAVGVTMWLWVFYRAKQDLPHMLVSRCKLQPCPHLPSVDLGV